MSVRHCPSTTNTTMHTAGSILPRISNLARVIFLIRTHKIIFLLIATEEVTTADKEKYGVPSDAIIKRYWFYHDTYLLQYCCTCSIIEPLLECLTLAEGLQHLLCMCVTTDKIAQLPQNLNKL